MSSIEIYLTSWKIVYRLGWFLLGRTLWLLSAVVFATLIVVGLAFLVDTPSVSAAISDTFLLFVVSALALIIASWFYVQVIQAVALRRFKPLKTPGLNSAETLSFALCVVTVLLLLLPLLFATVFLISLIASTPISHSMLRIASPLISIALLVLIKYAILVHAPRFVSSALGGSIAFSKARQLMFELPRKKIFFVSGLLVVQDSLLNFLDFVESQLLAFLLLSVLAILFFAHDAIVLVILSTEVQTDKNATPLSPD
ncbi:MAG: hypothetical protein NXH97_19720 [Rhodobacteraceae bacterium]|nr:hypothetical protein [Paracoccaceae bacterium]